MDPDARPQQEGDRQERSADPSQPAVEHPRQAIGDDRQRHRRDDDQREVEQRCPLQPGGIRQNRRQDPGNYQREQSG